MALPATTSPTRSYGPGTEFVHNYSPYHSNNVSATIGGPVIPHHQFFFFFAIEPLRASTSTGNSTQTYEDPQFANFAKQNFPNTLGTKILTSYPAYNATTTAVCADGGGCLSGDLRHGGHLQPAVQHCR